MSHASSFIFDRIIIKVAGNQDRHKRSDEFDFGSLNSMGFDLGTFDSGERSLPFGLLVEKYFTTEKLWDGLLLFRKHNGQMHLR